MSEKLEIHAVEIGKKDANILQLCEKTFPKHLNFPLIFSGIRFNSCATFSAEKTLYLEVAHEAGEFLNQT